MKSLISKKRLTEEEEEEEERRTKQSLDSPQTIKANKMQCHLLTNHATYSYVAVTRSTFVIVSGTHTPQVKD